MSPPEYSVVVFLIFLHESSHPHLHVRFPALYVIQIELPPDTTGLDKLAQYFLCTHM